MVYSFIKQPVKRLLLNMLELSSVQKSLSLHDFTELYIQGEKTEQRCMEGCFGCRQGVHCSEASLTRMFEVRAVSEDTREPWGSSECGVLKTHGGLVWSMVGQEGKGVEDNI